MSGTNNRKTSSILLVEDNPTNLFYLETIIKKYFPALALFIARNGKEAVNAYKEFFPEIILIDLHMPIMNGDIAAKEIRACAKGTPHSPIIIGLTASLPTLSSNTFQQYLDKYLVKPITKEQLHLVLNEQLAIIDQQRQHDLSMMPHHDFEELSVSLGHDDALIAEVLSYAANYLQDFPIKMALLIEQESWPELVKLAHELRGAALNARLPLLANLAYLVEHQVHFDKTAVLQQLEQIKHEIQTLIPLITPYTA
ncbi:hypothetical protein GCM10023231_02980 [Olivibacter ginsenosidimutans]|uniref:Response regulator n=1 Tax=Olivibacter ginsenosidimutans TaxID=1176537 RepID=A0ABP9AE95_9SPHI